MMNCNAKYARHRTRGRSLLKAMVPFLVDRINVSNVIYSAHRSTCVGNEIHSKRISSFADVQVIVEISCTRGLVQPTKYSTNVNSVPVTRRMELVCYNFCLNKTTYFFVKISHILETQKPKLDQKFAGQINSLVTS